jgi:hypothetical protein
MYPTTRLTKPHWMTYGLGWFQQDYRGRAVDFHTGSIDGMVAIHGLIRDERLGVYVLGNLDHTELRHANHVHGLRPLCRQAGARLERGVPEALHRAARRGGQGAGGERGEARQGHGAVAAAAAARGRLCGSATRRRRVTSEAGRLRIEYGAAFVGMLEHWHYNTFRATWKAGWRAPELVTFVVDEDGAPGALEMMGARSARARRGQGLAGWGLGG